MKDTFQAFFICLLIHLFSFLFTLFFFSFNHIGLSALIPFSLFLTSFIYFLMCFFFISFYVSGSHFSLRICLHLFFSDYFHINNPPQSLHYTSSADYSSSSSFSQFPSSHSPLSSLPSHITHFAPSTRITMNAFPNGTHVFYWDVNGTIKYGTVESTSHMMDGTQVINVLVDGVTQDYREVPDGAGGFVTRVVEIRQAIVSLPCSSVSKVT